MIFYYHANKTNFHKKGFALGLVLRVRVFGTSKWPIQQVAPLEEVSSKISILNLKLQVISTFKQDIIPVHINCGVVMILLQIWHPVFKQLCHHIFAILCPGLLTETMSVNRLVPVVNDGKYLCLSMMTIFSP